MGENGPRNKPNTVKSKQSTLSADPQITIPGLRKCGRRANEPQVLDPPGGVGILGDLPARVECRRRNREESNRNPGEQCWRTKPPRRRRKTESETRQFGAARLQARFLRGNTLLKLTLNRIDGQVHVSVLIISASELLTIAMPALAELNFLPLTLRPTPKRLSRNLVSFSPARTGRLLASPLLLASCVLARELHSLRARDQSLGSERRNESGNEGRGSRATRSGSQPPTLCQPLLRCSLARPSSRARRISPRSNSQAKSRAFCLIG